MEEAKPNYYDLVHDVPDWQHAAAYSLSHSSPTTRQLYATLCWGNLVLSAQLRCKSFCSIASVLEVPTIQLVARRRDLSLPQKIFEHWPGSTEAATIRLTWKFSQICHKSCHITTWNVVIAFSSTPLAILNLQPSPLLLNRSIKYGIRSSKTIDDPNLSVVLANYERHYPSDSASPRHKQIRRDVQPRCSRGQQICNEDLAHFSLACHWQVPFHHFELGTLGLNPPTQPQSTQGPLRKITCQPQGSCKYEMFRQEVFRHVCTVQLWICHNFG